MPWRQDLKGDPEKEQGSEEAPRFQENTGGALREGPVPPFSSRGPLWPLGSTGIQKGPALTASGVSGPGSREMPRRLAVDGLLCMGVAWGHRRARAPACAHGFLVEGGGRRCAQARSAGVPIKLNLPFPGAN